MTFTDHSDGHRSVSRHFSASPHRADAGHGRIPGKVTPLADPGEGNIIGGSRTTRWKSDIGEAKCGLDLPFRTEPPTDMARLPAEHRGHFNPRPDRGVQPPSGFSQIAKKRRRYSAAGSAAGFWGALWGKPCATFG